MGQRRKVVVSEHLLASAKRVFPVAGSAAGNPSFEMFEAGPLTAARRLFERWFDEAPEALPGTGIKVWATIDLPYFPPLAFYAALVGSRVQLLDVTIEDPQEYWALTDDDPP